jgi:hypothetical protein
LSGNCCTATFGKLCPQVALSGAEHFQLQGVCELEMNASGEQSIRLKQSRAEQGLELHHEGHVNVQRQKRR